VNNILPFGIGAWVFIGIYLSSLLIIGWVGLLNRRADTLQDFYLAGSGSRLYAGNTLECYPGWQ